ncbi:hypothetical protein C8R46DRAFT_1114331 [Mycena filopes]|nr:hypothetical protein C8R46DRAFT_1114331 [Mycena filopes]
MAILPQELVDAIIHEIDDIPTLQATCLVGSTFRRTSQRMLWRSFTLNTKDCRSSGAFSAFLDESPHIAGYIHHLNATFAWLEPEETRSFLRSLSKLEHVYSCRLSHMSLANHYEKSHSGFLTTFLDILARQPLRELDVNVTGPLPLDVFLRLLTMAPVMSCQNVRVKEDASQEQPSCLLPKLQNLHLGVDTKGIDDILAQPQFGYYTQYLLRLTLDNRSPNCKLIFTAASTLQHIAFNFPGRFSQVTVPTLPPLPTLRSVEFTFSFRKFVGFSDFILAVMDHSPVLEDLTVTFTRTPRNPDEMPDRWAPLLTALDTALAGPHTNTRPSIRWRFDLDLDGEDEGSRGPFVEFMSLMQGAMPLAHTDGRLALEAYSY